jgi:hypothetical protein
MKVMQASKGKIYGNPTRMSEIANDLSARVMVIEHVEFELIVALRA